MNAEQQEFDADVCIVGLGPTGLVMAHLLALRGLSVTVLEREPERYGMARAVYTDDQCLRILQTAGLADELHRDMLVDLPVRWLRKGCSPLAVIHDPRRTYGWPAANFLYQPAFEGAMEDALARHPRIEIRRGRQAVAVEQDAGGVIIRHRECAGTNYGRCETELAPGSERALRTRYLIAADGGRSFIREKVLGISMSGRAFPQRWLVIDLRAKPGATPFAHLPYFDFYCDPELPVVSCPQPFNRHRFEFMLHDGDETADFEKQEKALELLARFVDVDDVIVDRQLVYTFNALVADTWRDRRVFLAGDAAHMTPQFIGQGMNAGIRDADNLSWKIAEVVHGQSPSSILDTYESERRRHAKAMIKLSVFNKIFVSMGNPWGATLRDRALPIIRRTPGASTWLRQSRMKPRPKYRQANFYGQPSPANRLVGELFPQPAVREGSGATTRFDDAVGHGWTVLGIDSDPRSSLAMDKRPAETRRDITWATLARTGHNGNADNETLALEIVEADFARWLDKHGISAGSVVVLRPDKYVWGVVVPGDENALGRTVELLATTPTHAGVPASDLANHGALQ